MSQALLELSTRIEHQSTDDFGKFYMYASLLNVIAVRNKNFLETIPKYTSYGISTSMPYGSLVKESRKGFNAGLTLDRDFSNQVHNYQSQFRTNEADPARAAYKIALMMFGIGQLGDLAFIMSKMRVLLNTAPMSTQQYNADIYKGSDFDARKKGLMELLDSVQMILDLLKTGLQHTGYGLLTTIVTLSLLPIVEAVVGFVLSMILLTAAGYMAFRFFQNAYNALNAINFASENTIVVFKRLVNEQMSNIYTPNNLEFIIKAVVMPIGYALVTVQEHAATDQSTYEASQRNRMFFNNVSAKVEESSGSLMSWKLL